MSDDLSQKRPQDASRINGNEDWELKYWTKKLGCSEADLRSAVKEVGTSVDKVREKLGKGKG